MRLKRMLTSVVLIAAVAYVAFAFRGEMTAFARENVLIFTVGVLAAALVLGVAVLFLGMGLRHQRTLLREARRVAAQNPGTAGSKERGQPSGDTTSEPANPALLSLLASVEEAAARKRAGAPIEPDAGHAPALAPELYYQPVIALGDGAVAGYDVYRKVEMRNLVSEPRFVQTSPSEDAVHRAGFELQMVQTALAAARQVFNQDEPVSGSMLYVHVGAALVDHELHWTRLAQLLAAHPALSAQVTLCIAASALANPPQDRLDAIDRMLDADAGIGVNGLDFKPQALPDYMARALQVAIYEHNDVQEAGNPVAERRRACLDRLIGLGVHGCARGLASDTDIVDAMQTGATLGSGPVFAEPMRLRDEPRVATSANRAVQ